MLSPLGLDGEALPPLLLPLRHQASIFDGSFRRFNRRNLALVLAGFALTSLFLYGAEVGLGRTSTLEASWDLVTLTLLSGLLAALPVDLLSLSASVVALGEAVRQGRWDVLRLTNVHARDLIAAHQAMILARVWKPLAMATNLRIGASLGVAVWLVVIGGSSGILLNVALLFLLYPYIFEPRWRTPALVASGLMISAYARQSTSALLAAMGIVLLIWGAQAVLIGLLIFWICQRYLDMVLICPVAYLGLSALMYLAYQQIEKRTLATATRRMIACADDLR